MNEILRQEIQRGLADNSYALLSDLREAFGPTERGPYEVSRISCTGELELCDYRVGLVVVTARAIKNYSSGTWYSVLSITTVDDGSWQAWSPQVDTLEETLPTFNALRGILNDLDVLPTSDKLNEMLRPLGMFGHQE